MNKKTQKAKYIINNLYLVAIVVEGVEMCISLKVKKKSNFTQKSKVYNMSKKRIVKCSWVRINIKWENTKNK